MGRLFTLFGPRASGPSFWNRDRIANFIGVLAILCLGAVLYFSGDTKLLMPGPLASGHSAIKECSSCHTKSGVSQTSWIHGLVNGDPLADSNACLSCHRMPNTAFNAHSASNAVLERSTKRLTKVATPATAPVSAIVQNIAFPMKDVVGDKLVCATCHQEHKGRNFDLNKISNEQCRSCHVVQFDSFDGNHPEFQNYPFRRRTRIIYDHASHFGKHYPEVAKKDPAKLVPENCSTCHNSNADRRVMDVAPFDRTCAACHLDQIAGKERVSGPKGVAFLALPGLDLETLRQKNAPIGEWPEDSEAALTPFMKLMISRSEEGRTLVEAVDKLNLQDLASASDSDIQAVTKLAWEIKGLYYALIKNKGSDVLAGLDEIGSKSKRSTTLVADLTASMPRDVVASAQQEWLPRLAAEIALGAGAGAAQLSSVSAPAAALASSDSDASGGEAAAETEVAAAETEAATAEAGSGDGAASNSNETTCKDEEPAASDAQAEEEEAEDTANEVETASLYDDVAASADGRIVLQSGTPRQIKASSSKKAKKKAKPEKDESAGSNKPCVEGEPAAEQVASAEPAGEASPAKAEPAADVSSAGAETPEAAAEAPAASAEAPAAAAAAPAPPSGQKDDLLFPTEEELSANNLDGDAFKKAAQGGEAVPVATAPAAAAPENAPPADAAATEKQDAPAAEAEANAAAAEPASPATPAPVPTPNEAQSAAAPAASPAPGIESDVDPETWAEYGGWYRQDYAIYYRPAGHKDKFIYSWLVLTGRLAPEGSTGAATEVFNSLTNKEAQGSCTKCHSVDDNRDRGKAVNFTPASLTSKRGRFTNFIHEPHLGAMDDRGCLTCHALGKNRPYLKSYEQGSPRKFAQEFSNVKKDLCQTCHTQGAARQDCLMCHKYHVNGSTMPVLKTKLTVQ
jgi:hypothetical protein